MLTARIKKVLLADDDASIRRLIRTVLEKSGYLVFEARNGAEAVCKASEHLPDLIILDMNMPILDGFGAVKVLRSDPQFAATPIVAISASTIRDEHDSAFAGGFSSHVAKPMTLTELRSEAERWLGRELAHASRR